MPDWHSLTWLWSAWLSWTSQLRADILAPWSAWLTWMNAMNVHHLLVAEIFWVTWCWFPESAFGHQNDLNLDFRSLDEEVVVWKPYEFCLRLTWIAESLNPADFERLQSWSYKSDLDAEHRLDVVVLVFDLLHGFLYDCEDHEHEQ